MSPAMIGFLFGVVVGGLGGFLLIGLLLMCRERKGQEQIHEAENVPLIHSDTGIRLSGSGAVPHGWGTLPAAFESDLSCQVFIKTCKYDFTRFTVPNPRTNGKICR